MRYLAIDYGLKRIGLAVSDASGCMSFPLETLKKTTNEKLFAELQSIIRSQGIDALVVGLPRGLEGQGTLSTRQARNFARKLGSITGLPVSMVDEALTSALAEEKLKQSGVRPKKRKEYIDQQAAVEILNSFLTGKEPFERDLHEPNHD